MKHKNLKIIAVFAIVCASCAIGFNVYNKSQLSTLCLSNIEAIAEREGHGTYEPCPYPCVENGGGCYCHQEFPTYKEYKGKF